MFGRGDKKGLSTIVATLLIILLTLVAVGIIWIVVRNVIQGGAEQISLGKFTLDLQISQVQRINDSALSIIVKRNVGDGDFVGIAFIAEDDSNKEVVKKNISMNELDIRRFELYFLTINVSRLKKISIAPIFRLESGKEVNGDVEDEYTIGGSSGTSTCTPYCPSGAMCGSDGCGGVCGTCSGLTPNCINYQCSAQVCTPSCLNRECGSNGCTGSCGTCLLANAVSQCTLAYQCTITSCNAGYSNCDLNVSNGCETTLGTMTNCASCGNACTIGQTCTNYVCTSPSQPCGAGTCESGEYCSTEAGVCLLQVSGNTYFVSTTGNDNNPGNFTHPFATWKKGFESVRPGDIVYVRGGVYMAQGVAENHVTMAYINGTRENQLYFFNFPGENPILDGSELTPGPGGWNTAINIVNSRWFNFRGLTVRNFYQYIPEGATRSQMATGFSGWGCTNFHYENCVVHDVGGRGFFYASAGDEVDNSSWINCDAYNNADALSFYTINGTVYDNAGNGADGFFIQLISTNYPLPNYSATAYIHGCRAWRNSDDGFNLDGDAYMELRDCWSFNNDYPSIPLSEGNGFKIDARTSNITNRIVTNCIAANNAGIGYDPNSGLSQQWARQKIYNSMSYNNSYGIFIQNCAEAVPSASANTYRNILSYRETWPLFAGPWVLERKDYLFTEDHNTWRFTSLDWPYIETNPAYSVTDADFVSLDVSQLARPRKADGSLPDVTFGHLAPGSDLIDAGVDVGLPYSGSAPDIGPFESSY